MTARNYWKSKNSGKYYHAKNFHNEYPISNNFTAKGRVIGLFGFLTVICVILIPPFFVLSTLNIEPYAPKRLVVRMIWFAYSDTWNVLGANSTKAEMRFTTCHLAVN